MTEELKVPVKTYGAIAAALAKAQGAMKAAKKDTNNPFFKSKYADLSSVWDACREQLAKNGLSITQIPYATDTGVGVKTILMHESGEFIEGFLALKPKDLSPQSAGSAITYARRYALAAMVGVAQEDDDGNEASSPPPKKQNNYNNRNYQKGQPPHPADNPY